MLGRVLRELGKAGRVGRVVCSARAGVQRPLDVGHIGQVRCICELLGHAQECRQRIAPLRQITTYWWMMLPKITREIRKITMAHQLGHHRVCRLQRPLGIGVGVSTVSRQAARGWLRALRKNSLEQCVLL